jgi:hypothetical protein
MRKQIIEAGRGAAGLRRGSRPAGVDIAAVATVLYTSESTEHPVDYLFDADDGPGGSRWEAATDGEQTLILAFDTPQSIREVSLETEERRTSRTQVLTLSLSQDGGAAYREVLRQEFTFSPPGTTYERESWSVPAEGVTHLRVVIRPDKGNAPGRATLTSLAVR